MLYYNIILYYIISYYIILYYIYIHIHVSPYDNVRIKTLAHPDHRGTIHTRFLSHTHIYIYIYVYIYTIIHIYIYWYCKYPKNGSQIIRCLIHGIGWKPRQMLKMACRIFLSRAYRPWPQDFEHSDLVRSPLASEASWMRKNFRKEKAIGFCVVFPNGNWLVVSTPLKNISQLGFPNIWKNKKCSKPPTRQI